MNDLTLAEQVWQALATFHDAHESAEFAAAAFYEARRLLGTNKDERAQTEKTTTAEIFSILVDKCNAGEQRHKAAAAHLERTEKNLNVLRELLNHQTAEIHRDTARVESDTADRYARITGTRVSSREIQSHIARVGKPTNGDDLPF